MNYNYERILDLSGLSESNVIRGNATGIEDDAALEIVYDKIEYGAMSGAVDWLLANRLVIKDVEVGGQKFDGVWRTLVCEQRPVIRNGSKDSSVVVHRYAKGYYDNMEWPFARIQSDMIAQSNTTQPEEVTIGKSSPFQRIIEVRMPYVNPDRVDAIIKSLDAPVYTDRTVGRNVKLEGTFFHMGAVGQVTEDGTHSVVLRLAAPKFTIKGYRDNDTPKSELRYLCTGVPNADVQPLIDAWKVVGGQPRKGASAYVEAYHFDRNTANVMLTLDAETEDLYRVVASEEDCFTTTSESTDLHKSAPGVQPAFQQGKVVRVTSEKTDLGNYNVTTRTTEAKPAKEGQRNLQATMPEQVLGELTRNAVEPNFDKSNPPHQVPGEIRGFRATRNDLCMWDNDEQVRSAIEREEVSGSTEIDAFTESESVADVNLIAEPVLPTTQTPGQITRMLKRLNDFLRWDKEETTRKAVEQKNAGESISHEATQISRSVEDQNAIEEPILPEIQEAGYIRSLRKRLNAFLRWEVQSDEREAVEREDIGKSAQHDAFRVVATAESQNLVLEPTLPTVQTAGAIRRLRKRMNAFLRWDTEDETQTAVERTNAGETRTHEAFQTTTATEQTNVVAEPTLPTVQTPGEIRTLGRRLNAFLRWDVQAQDRVAVTQPDAVASRTKTVFEDMDETQGQNLVSEPVLPTALVAGKITTIRKRLNAFLRWDKDEQTRESKVVTDAVASKSEDTFEERESDTIRNSASAARDPISADGVIQVSRVEKSEFHERIHDTLEQRSAKTVSDANKVNTANTFESQSSDTIRNKSGVSRTPSSTNGVIQTVRVEKSEFPDRVHDTLEERTAITVPDSQQSSSSNTFESQESNTIRNSASEKRTPVSENGVIQTSSVEKSEFPDRIHDTLSRRTANEVALASQAETETAFEAVTRDTTRNAGTKRIVTPVAGKIQIHTVEKSEFPDRLHDTVEVKEAVYRPESSVDTSITALSISRSAVDRNAVFPVAEENVFVAGKVKAARSVLNEYQRFDNTTSEAEAVPWDSGWIEYNDTYGKSYYRVFGNQTLEWLDVVKEELVRGGQNSLNVGMNEFGRYDGSITAITTRVSGQDFENGTEWTTQETQKHEDFKYFAAATNYIRSFTLAVAFVKTAISGYGGALVDYGAGEKTGLKYLGQGLWKATRVEGRKTPWTA